MSPPRFACSSGGRASDLFVVVSLGCAEDDDAELLRPVGQPPSFGHGYTEQFGDHGRRQRVCEGLDQVDDGPAGQRTLEIAEQSFDVVLDRLGERRNRLGGERSCEGCSQPSVIGRLVEEHPPLEQPHRAFPSASAAARTLARIPPSVRSTAADRRTPPRARDDR